MKIASAIGITLVGCGMIGLACVGTDSAQQKLSSAFHTSTPTRGLPVSPAAGGAMFVSGAILLFSGRNRIS